MCTYRAPFCVFRCVLSRVCVCSRCAAANTFASNQSWRQHQYVPSCNSCVQCLHSEPLLCPVAERVAAVPAVPEQTAPTQADPVAPQIPIPRPVRPQVGPPSDVMAPTPSLPFKSSAPISAPGSAPWSRSSSMDQLHGAQGPLHEPAPQPQHSHEPANTVNTMTNQFQEDPVHEPSNSANNVDPVASAANAALSTNSLFSAFANSQVISLAEHHECCVVLCSNRISS